MEEVFLNNGSRELKVLVAATLVTLTHLLDSGLPGVLACHDLVMLCRNRDYTVYGPSLKLLQKFSLVEPTDNKVHDSIRNVVLSWSNGEGENMVFGINPVKR